MTDINGTPNGDFLSGTSGADLIDGSGGNDTVYGNDGDDRLLGGAGNDQLDGGAGTDILEGQDGADVLTGGDSGDDQLFGGAGDDFLEAGGSTFAGGSRTVLLDGGAGDDNLSASGGYADPSRGIPDRYVQATLIAGDGADIIWVGGNIDAVVDAGADNDTIALWGPKSATLTLGGGSDLIRLWAAPEGLVVVTDFTPGSGGDRIEFGDAVLQNYLVGWSEDNPFGTGHMRLVQDGGATVLQVDRDAAGDAYAWVSVLRFENTQADQFVAHNLFDYPPNGEPPPGQTLVGSEAGDTLEGTIGADLIQGLGGNDYISAGAGADVVEGGAGDDMLWGQAGDDRLEGGDGNDTLGGADGDNVLIGGGGDDVLIAGNSIYDTGHQTLDGGQGNDTFYLYLNAEEPQSVTATGGDGDDVLEVYGPGQVTFDGGAGADLVKLTDAGRVTLTLGSGADTVAFGVSNGVEPVAPQAVVITDFAAGPGGDRLDLLAYIDATLVGWDHDTNPFATGHLRLTQVGGAAVLQINPSGDHWYDLVVFEGVQSSLLTAENLGGYPASGATPGGVTLTGGEGADTLTGGIGPDLLSGAGGADVLDGGRGDDRLEGGAGNDQLEGGSGDDVLLGGDGNDQLRDSAGLHDQVYGGDGNDNLFVTRYGQTPGGADILLDGGSGADQISFSGSTALAGEGWEAQDAVRIFGGRGSDRIELWNVSYAYIDAGADQDVVRIDTSVARAEITLGAGSDTLEITSFIDSSRLPFLVVTDFNAAEDKIAGVGGTDLYRFVASGSDTLLQFNADGRGDDWITFVQFENLTAANLAASNLNYGTPSVWLAGTEGADHLETSGSYGQLAGGGGDDVLTGATKADVLNGGGGSDALSGAGGDDRLIGGGGDDVYDGGTGFDVVDFSRASTGVVVDLGRADAQDTGEGLDSFSGIEGVTGSAFDDRLTGSAGDDVLSGGLGNNVLNGGAGNDVVHSGYGRNVIAGGAGDDVLYSEGGEDRVDGGDGFDWIDLSAFDWGVRVNLGVTTEQNTGGTYLTLSGVEAARGGDGNDRLTGSAGANTLEGGKGQDLLAGGAGDDTFVFGKGDGQDTISDFVAGGTDDRIQVTGYATYQELRQQGADTLVVLSASDSILLKNVSASALTAGDFVFVPGPAAPAPLVQVTLMASATIPASHTGHFVYDGVTGHEYAYYLAPPIGALSPLQLAINGALDFRSDNPAARIELIRAWYGPGVVTNNGRLTVESAGGGVAFYSAQGDYSFVNTGTVQVAASGQAIGFLFYSSGLVLENKGTIDVVGADAQGAYVANGGRVVNSGSIRVVGGIHGAAVGLAFNGDVDLQNSGAIVADDGDPTTLHSAGVTYYGYGYSVDETRIVNASTGVITGDYAIRELDALSGSADYGVAYVDNRGTMNGKVDLGQGVDTLVNTGVINGLVDLGTENDVYSGGGLVNGAVLGQEGADVLRGGAAVDVFDGGEDDDILEGWGGADVLTGGAGNDRLDGGTGTDTAAYASATSGVTVNLALSGAQATGGAGVDTLISIENLTGSSFADVLRGNSGANILAGGGGDDRLEGGAGADRLDGGAGIDQASYANAASAVSVNLTSDVHTGEANGDVFVSIERFGLSRFSDQFTGSAAADEAFGDLGNDTLFGAAGNDVLEGGDGNDILRGGLGADRLIGGAGTDQANYQVATAAVTLNLTTGVHTGEAAGDTFSSIERFVLSGYGDQFTGSAGADEAVGYYGNDILFGAAGNDKLDGGNGNDILRGGEGADQLIGGTGVDTASYQVATAAVALNLTTGVHTGEAAGDTFDAIERFALSTLNDSFIGSAGADWVDGWKGNDVLDGQGGADQMFGNEGNDELHGGIGNDVLHGDGGVDELYGDAGADVLYGGTGADKLFGGDDGDFLWGEAGADTLTGGAGADRFAFSTGSGVDVITDFVRGQDKIILKGMAGIDDFSDVRISAESHGWAVITWGDGTSTITLTGIAAAQVTASDIWFTG